MLKIRDCVIAGLCLAVTSLIIENAHAGENPTETATSRIGKMKVGGKDWPQWGGSYSRNNTPDALDL